MLKDGGTYASGLYSNNRRVYSNNRHDNLTVAY